MKGSLNSSCFSPWNSPLFLVNFFLLLGGTIRLYLSHPKAYEQSYRFNVTVLLIDMSLEPCSPHLGLHASPLGHCLIFFRGKSVFKHWGGGADAVSWINQYNLDGVNIMKQLNGKRITSKIHATIKHVEVGI